MTTIQEDTQNAKTRREVATERFERLLRNAEIEATTKGTPEDQIAHAIYECFAYLTVIVESKLQDIEMSIDYSS